MRGRVGSETTVISRGSFRGRRGPPIQQQPPRSGRTGLRADGTSPELRGRQVGVSLASWTTLVHLVSSVVTRVARWSALP